MGPPNENSYQVWFQLAQWFERRLKCKTLQTTDFGSGELNILCINPYHAELYIQDITCMLNCFEEISQNLAFFLFLLCS